MNMRKLFAGLLALTILTGCSSASSTADTEDSNKLTTKAIMLDDDDTLYPIGDSITIDNVTYTLESARQKTIGSQDYEYCYVRIENNSDEPIETSWTSWYLLGSGEDGMWSVDAMMSNDPTLLETGTLEPGEETSGYIVYEVKPKGELVLQPPGQKFDEPQEMWLVRTFDD